VIRVSIRARLTAALVVLLVAATPLVASEPRLDELRIMAPAAPGGGWDQTARAMQQALVQSGLVRIAPVDNVPGAAGTIGLARFIGAERGRGDTLMVSGLIMLGGIVMHRSPVTLHDVVPIARLTGEYEVIAVPAASPFHSLRDLLEAFKAHPESISWGGGSAGGSDQILAGLVADAIGVAPRRINYVAFSGGGESLSAILGSQVSCGVNGLAEFAPHMEAGTLRALAISSAERLPGLDVPTLREQGINVAFENWRSVVAPVGIADVDRRRLESLVEAMVHGTPWRDMLDRYRWLDRYLVGASLPTFIDAEEVRVRDILNKFDAGRERTVTLSSTGVYPLIVLGGVVVFGLAAGRSVRRSTRDDRTSERPLVERRLVSLGLIAIGIVIHVLLLERIGFVPAAAVLFWFTARAFDHHHPLRDATFAIALAIGSYLLFARVLQLQLPAGILERLL
jgi:putative tricarboxylic transport membrane protein